MTGREKSDRDAGGGLNGAPEHGGGVYFPLPANKDQLEIVRKLQAQTGIHVQGPPGTGKSHTIANLICHLLACGKRVLITAQTPRALKVLHDKIPREMQPLCVSLLGNDRASFNQLERCVGEIISRFGSWRESDYQQRVHEAEAALQRHQGELATLGRHLRALRERETVEHEVASGAYRGTGAAIAAQLSSETAQYEWIIDAPDPATAAPLSNRESTELLNLLRTLATVNPRDLTHSIISSTDAQALVEELGPLFDAEKDAVSQIDKRPGATGTGSADRASASPPEVLADLIHSLDAFVSKLRSALARRQGWVVQAIGDVLADNDTPWRSLRDALPVSASELLAAAKRRESVHLSFPPEWDPVKGCADAEDLRGFLAGGGSLGLLSALNPIVKRTKYLRKSVRADGRAADSVQTLDVVIDCLKSERRLDDAWKHWSEHVQRPSGSFMRQASLLAEHCESLDAVLQLYSLREQACQHLARIAGLPAPNWADPDSVQMLIDTLQHARAVRRKTEAERAIRARLAPLRDAVARSSSHQTLQQLYNALVARHRPDTLRAIESITKLEHLRLQHKRQDELLGRLKVRAPETAARLSSEHGDEHWDSRLSDFESAWNYARAQSWLDDTFGDSDEQECEAQIRALNEQVGQTTARLAADLAWMRCLGRMSEEHRRHFVAWAQAMKSLGKGTGKYAEKHRQDAQRHLAKCREAIPAWVMPLHFVFDSVEPFPEVFDVVIVDEASQCGLDARVLAYLTKQLVVVGDDKQISPEAVGVSRAEVDQLIQQHLSGLPHNDSFQPERSLFDFADLWFGERIVLQEHFRCVPEIIRFSSDLCYQQKPLLPLRQYPPERLRPIVTRRVAGSRAGSGSSVTNVAEADEIVKAILACHRDPKYKDKEFGVISLQGEGQAKLIEKKLLDALDARDIERRRIVCGNAYSFQGDERHVMFLSMVAAPNEYIGALTKEADVRRFNVAMSRAQDQVWLVHSVDSNDLSAECCRRRLLDYCLQPRQQTFRGQDINAWKQAALGSRRRLGEQPAPFESWFELDVFLRLVEKGYRVIPQYEIAFSRIDLMVEGMRSRLAVECNGEHWHGPDRWQQDQDRQRRLERAGLRFFTVWESAFRRSPSETLEPLWHALEKHDIQPIGTGESSTLDMDGYAPSLDASMEPTESPSSETQEAEVKPSPTQAPSSENGASEVSLPTSAEGQWSLRTESESQQEALFVAPTILASPQSSTEVESYAPWQPKQLPDPRTAPIKELVEGLKSIVAVEGPIQCLRAYQTFSRAAGLLKLHSATRARFNQAIQRGVEHGLFELGDGYGTQYQMNRFVRLKGTPSIRVRTLGNRTLHEVAPDELAAMISLLAVRHGPQNREQLYRRVLEVYGLVRATEQATATLDEARRRIKPPLDVV